jgi:anaphase-promoting complex subunit 4
LPYEDHSDGKIPKGLRFEAENLSDLLSVARVPSGAGFVPIHMEVVEASAQRGDIPSRVCILGKDKVTYKVYSLPRNWEPKMDVVLQEDVMMDE